MCLHLLGGAPGRRRGVVELAEAIDVFGATLGRFVESGVEREDAARLIALLERLEELGVPEPWRLAEPLAVAGVDGAWLDQVAAIAGPATAAALAWTAATLTAHNLAAELQEATRRMSSLVGAVKSYAYMERGGVVEVDLHEGLETTPTVLGHRLGLGVRPREDETALVARDDALEPVGARRGADEHEAGVAGEVGLALRAHAQAAQAAALGGKSVPGMRRSASSSATWSPRARSCLRMSSASAPDGARRIR